MTVGIELPEDFSSKSAESVTNKFDALFQEIVTLDNLYQGFLKASKGKRNRKNVYLFEKNLMTNLNKLKSELISKTYKPKECRIFTITCPNSGKMRKIEAPDFRDAIVQHAIYNHVYWLFDKTFIHDNYGCRIGKGTHKCADRCQEFLRKCEGDAYYLQLDFRKYYYSIDRQILSNAIKHQIKDFPDVCELMDKFIFTDYEENGLGIGNLLSQLFGLIYLNRFDHYIKRVLKIKNYIRYVDDSVLIGLSLQEAKVLAKHLEDWCKENLNLEFSKVKIHKIKHGINFVGFRTWRSKRYIRKKALQNFSKAVKREKWDSVNALLEHSFKTTSFSYLINTLNTHNLQNIHKRYKT